MKLPPGVVADNVELGWVEDLFFFLWWEGIFIFFYFFFRSMYGTYIRVHTVLYIQYPYITR